MQKIEVIPVKSVEDLKQMNLYPELSYRLDADLNLNETEQSEVMIPNLRVRWMEINTASKGCVCRCLEP